MSSRARCFLSLTMVFAWMAAGCAPQAKKPTPAEDAAGAQSRLEQLQTGRPLTDRECQQFAEAFGKTIEEGDIPIASGLVDWEALLELTTGGIDAPRDFRAGFIKGLREQFATANSPLLSQFASFVADGGSFQVVHVHKQDGQSRAWFRILSKQGELNYVDVVLARRNKEAVRAIDFYPLRSGELFSQTMRNMYLQGLSSQNGGVLEKLTGAENAWLRHVQAIAEMGQACQQQRFGKALEIYGKLPAEVRLQKMPLLLRITAAQKADPEEFQAAVADFRKAFPREACVDILSVDYFYNKGEYARALKCVNRVDEAIGIDPYLDGLRGMLYLGDKDYAEAEKASGRVLKLFPDLLGAYWPAVSVALEQKQYARVAELLSQISAKFRWQFNLTAIPLYAGFVKSPEYREWVKTHPPAE